ncbi:MAG: hypothetical protein EPO25_11080 [Gammaproteobacteria bacterium]|nr:MAG: hypothetical protein EPO25_11080 [Gammaproteobacteria bacterium]
MAGTAFWNLTTSRGKRLLATVGMATVAPVAAFAIYMTLGSALLVTRQPGPILGGAGTVATSTAAITSLVVEAQTARRQRDFQKAVTAFERLAGSDAMTADLWADYADAAGALHGSLDRAEPWIDRALALDPRHLKALWLKGSLQTERQDFRGALETWQALLALLPPDSTDARLVAANLDEARAALGPG